MGLGARLFPVAALVLLGVSLPLGAQDQQPGSSGNNAEAPDVVNELPEENRQEISEALSENTQDAVTLRRLLLGRSYHFFGRIEGEAAMYSGDRFDGEDGADIRRLRLGIAGVLSDRVSYKAEIDLTDKTTSVSDVYVKVDTLRLGSLTVGNQRVAQNLSAMTGALSQLFMEDPLPVTSFSLSRRLAISQDIHSDRWAVHGSLFSRDPNNDAGKRGWSIRTVINPARKADGIAHIGFSVVREEMDREGRYRTRPESHVTDVRLVDTGPYNDLRYQNLFGLEAAGAAGSLSGRIEGFRSTWERAGGKESTFYGAYLEVGYFLTGQNFRYRQGRFARPNMGGRDAWEIGGRISWVDLNDQDVQGGEQVNLGLAVNYYPRQNVRIQSNLLRVRTSDVPDHDRSWIAQARIQINW
ncbi:MAG: hypothetical protein HKP16_12450 [Xanthomonadales bacterium]|nr:hypothetical protein [Xanthomonadales bacterium]